MKIVQLVYSLCLGGAEKFVVDLSNQLAENGHDVTICMLRKADSDDDKLLYNKQFLSPKVKFCCLGFSKGFSMYKSYKVINYMTSLKPDVIHCHLNVIPYLYGIHLFNNKIRIYHTLHSLAQKTVSKGLQVKINRWFYKSGIITPITISKECNDSYRELYGLNNSYMIQNGRSRVPYSSRIKDVRAEIEGLRSSDGGGKVFIHVARYNPLKNQQLLVEAFNKLHIDGMNFSLLVIGDGFDSEDAKKLNNLACSSIHFLGPKNNVQDYLKFSDAFCLSSSYEGLPISLLEALSEGVTPVCTNVGGIKDVLQEGVTGYLSDSVTVDAFCDAIKRFIEKPLNHDYLIKYYEDNFSMEKCSSEYEDVFENNSFCK